MGSKYMVLKKCSITNYLVSWKIYISISNVGGEFIWTIKLIEKNVCHIKPKTKNKTLKVESSE